MKRRTLLAAALARRRGGPRPRRRHRPRRRPRPLGHPDRQHHASTPRPSSSCRTTAWSTTTRSRRTACSPTRATSTPPGTPPTATPSSAAASLGASTWSTVKVGHTLRYNDSHNVISMGVSKVDGRLHLNMDSHSDGFTYVKSVAGLLDNPAGLSWTASRFGAPQSTLDGLALTSQFTYPQFVSTPDGRLQLSYRVGGLRQRPQRARRVRRHQVDQPRRVVQLHRHVHQRARLQHGPQHVPARHRLRPQRPPARLLHLARAERRRDVQRRRHHQPRHRLRLLGRPGPHLAQQRGHRRRHHRRLRQGRPSPTPASSWTRSTRTTP